MFFLSNFHLYTNYAFFLFIFSLHLGVEMSETCKNSRKYLSKTHLIDSMWEQDIRNTTYTMAFRGSSRSGPSFTWGLGELRKFEYYNVRLTVIFTHGSPPLNITCWIDFDNNVSCAVMINIDIIYYTMMGWYRDSATTKTRLIAMFNLQISKKTRGLQNFCIFVNNLFMFKKVYFLSFLKVTQSRLLSLLR